MDIHCATIKTQADAESKIPSLQQKGCGDGLLCLICAPSEPINFTIPFDSVDDPEAPGNLNLLTGVNTFGDPIYPGIDHVFIDDRVDENLYRCIYSQCDRAGVSWSPITLFKEGM